jgi:hypothetical protein
MKQFIYLDNDIINSIIAQKDNGLIKDIKTENSSIFDQKEENVINSDIDGKLTGGLFKIATAEAKLSLGAKLGKEKDVTNTTREILEKTMHDATFDIAYDYIKAKKIEIGNNLNDDCGEYVELKRVFDFVDLDYVEGLFSKNGLIDYLKKSTSYEIRKTATIMTNKLNREQKRTSTNQINGEIKKAIDEKNKEFDNISDIINAFRKMIPYNRMLISNDGYLIPLDEKYFRVNPSSIGFMYGGDITCVGMITNIIGKDTNPNDDKNIFATLQFSVNEALRSILPTNEENICVIHPIAVYYNK